MCPLGTAACLDSIAPVRGVFEGSTTSVLDRHAHASEVLAILDEQIPPPLLPDSPEDLLAETLEPEVSLETLTIDVPAHSVPHFSTLNQVLGEAVQAADAGHFLGPPTQPEIDEMRRWLCHEVMDQADGVRQPQPWRTGTDVRTVVRHGEELLEAFGSGGRSASTEGRLSAEAS